MCLDVSVDLRKAHEQQKMTLEQDFEVLRLSLQVWLHEISYWFRVFFYYINKI